MKIISLTLLCFVLYANAMISPSKTMDAEDFPPLPSPPSQFTASHPDDGMRFYGFGQNEIIRNSFVRDLISTASMGDYVTRAVVLTNDNPKAFSKLEENIDRFKDRTKPLHLVFLVDGGRKETANGFKSKMAQMSESNPTISSCFISFTQVDEGLIELAQQEECFGGKNSDHANGFFETFKGRTIRLLEDWVKTVKDIRDEMKR